MKPLESKRGNGKIRCPDDRRENSFAAKKNYAKTKILADMLVFLERQQIYTLTKRNIEKYSKIFHFNIIKFRIITFNIL